MPDRNLNDLHPDIKPLCEQFLQDCKSHGLDVIITETFRDPTREDDLHAKGITRATGFTCKHCFMLNHKPASKAFDFAILDENNRLVTDGEDERYQLAGVLGKKIGLHYGGDFSHPDWDHFEIA